MTIDKNEVLEQEKKELKKRIKTPCNDKPYVFISYSSLDSKIVYEDVLELQRRGVNIWIDKELETKLGTNWWEHAEDAIANKNCKMVIFYISEYSISSPQVCKELLFTQSQETKSYNRGEALSIIPIDLVKMPENNIKYWIQNDILDLYPNCKLDKEHELKYNDKIIKKKYDVASLILREIFGDKNAQTRHPGYEEHDEKYFDILVKLFEDKKPEKDKLTVINQNISNTETENEQIEDDTTIFEDNENSDAIIAENQAFLTLRQIEEHNNKYGHIYEYSSEIMNDIFVFYGVYWDFETNLWGLRNKNNAIIIHAKYKNIIPGQHMGSDLFLLVENENGKYGVINEKNEIILPFSLTAVKTIDLLDNQWFKAKPTDENVILIFDYKLRYTYESKFCESNQEKFTKLFSWLEENSYVCNHCG